MLAKQENGATSMAGAGNRARPGQIAYGIITAKMAEWLIQAQGEPR